MIPRELREDATTARAHVIDINCPEAVWGEATLKSGITDMYPGMLIDLDATTVNRPGELPIAKKHATAGGPAILRIAKNNLMSGQAWDIPFSHLDDVTVNNDGIVGEDTVIHDHIPFFVPKPGEGFMARVADEFTASNGDYLKSGGNGNFVQHAGTGVALCQVDDEDGVDYSIDPPPDDRVLLVRAVAL